MLVASVTPRGFSQDSDDPSAVCYHGCLQTGHLPCLLSSGYLAQTEQDPHTMRIELRAWRL